MNEMMRILLFLPEQASTVASRIDALHFLVISVTMLGAAGVALVTLYWIVKYRARPERGESAEHDVDVRPVRKELSLRFELFGFGGLLALFVFFWVIGFRQYVYLAAPPPNATTVYVTGKQWMWSFAYPNGGGSNGVIYVPVGRPVKLVMTSRDVIHSFFVPAFRVKQDVVPGRSTTLWFEVKHPGRYPVYCTEYCGIDHSLMRAEVVALSDADYERQMSGIEPAVIATADVSLQPQPEGKGPPVILARVGERVAAERGCFRCHTPDGTPHIGPTFAGLYGARISLEDGHSIVADDAYLTASMMDPGAQIHAGFKNVMPSYQGVVSAPEVAALVEFIRSLRDVHRFSGEEPLPKDVTGVPIVTPLSQGQQQPSGQQP
ncbi:MAG: cytochrome c oxidase subunit II, partial [Kofleriaceae bacterium]|nr:cytochrome c oxidase subunit II [Kofleriaceae bacterium]